jgi:hypothetical protein
MQKSEFDQLEESFEDAIALINGDGNYDINGQTYKIFIFFDPCLFKFKKMGVFGWVKVGDQKLGISVDKDFSPDIHKHELIVAQCLNLLVDKVIHYLRDSTRVPCHTCGGQGWYVDFQNRKPCPDCKP